MCTWILYYGENPSTVVLFPSFNRMLRSRHYFEKKEEILVVVHVKRDILFEVWLPYNHTPWWFMQHTYLNNLISCLLKYFYKMSTFYGYFLSLLYLYVMNHILVTLIVCIFLYIFFTYLFIYLFCRSVLESKLLIVWRIKVRGPGGN
jgi:hypothetical protein